MIAIGTAVTIDPRHGWEARNFTATVLGFEPHYGQGGFRIEWRYGRKREQWESSGGWVPASLVTLAKETP